MSEPITLLARLMSDPDARAAFLADRAAFLASCGLPEEHRPLFLALDAETLEHHAGGLLHKRFREVAELIPRTMHALGPSARAQFLEYAAQSWPSGHRRHLNDAAAFCAYLRRHGHDPVPAERHWIAFVASQSRFRIHSTWQRGLVIHVLSRGPLGHPRQRWLGRKRPLDRRPPGRQSRSKEMPSWSSAVQRP